MTVFAGLIDSGVSGPASHFVSAAQQFLQGSGGEVAEGPVGPDRLGHGSALAGIITDLAPDVRLLNAQIFDARGVTTPAVVAAAIDWAVAGGACLINLSVGLRADRLVLRQACTRAMAKGVFLLASSPARGGPVFPASYKGVLRISGDARCAQGEISALQNVQADFGAHPRATNMIEGKAGGASFAVAWVTGLIAAYLADHPDAGYNRVVEYLISSSRYHGAERRLT